MRRVKFIRDNVMLFIRSISYCLEQIQAYFNYQLSSADYETSLAQKFSFKSEAKIAVKLPGELLRQAPVHRHSSEPGLGVDALSSHVASMSLNTSTHTSPVQSSKRPHSSPLPRIEPLSSQALVEGEEKRVQAVVSESDQLDSDQDHKLLLQSEQSMASSSQPSSFLPSSQAVPHVEASLQSMACSSTSSSHQEKMPEHDWTNIPLAGVGIIKEKGFYHNPLQVSASVDDMSLRFGVTWGQMVNSTYDDFVSILDNNLKQESLTDVKMLVLARYARQLQIIKAWGTKILEARDEYIKALALKNSVQKEEVISIEKEMMRFYEQPVDTWLIQLTSIAKEEAMQLFARALGSHKLQLGLGLEFTYSAGDSEDMVTACDHTIVQFFLNMKEHDQKIDVPRIQDLFPSQLQSQDALISSFMFLTHYLSQNWFTEGMFLAHKDRGTYLRADQYTFDPEKTVAKRRSAIELMSKLETQLPLAKTASVYWDRALQLVDEAALDAAFLTTPKGYFASYVTERDRLPITLQALHMHLAQQADHKAYDVVAKHRSCKFH